MKIKILSIGLGGVGVIGSYTLERNNPDVEITAVVRSDYERVKQNGYSISSIDYGGRRNNSDPNESENLIKGYRPKNMVKSLLEAKKYGPFDYIVISTKVIPYPKDNIWDQVEQYPELIKAEKQTSIVLLQNGIGIEKYWTNLKDEVNLISGVSYISSTNNQSFVTQYGTDDVKFGLFFEDDSKELLERFVKLYSNDINSATVDKNVRFTRWRKLLYNSTYNTVCCLSDLDVGKIYELDNDNQIVDKVIIPLMREVQLIANHDLELKKSTSLLLDSDIETTDRLTKATDARQNYEPSMLVDSRNGRLIELEVILGNVIEIHKENTNNDDLKQEIPYLNLLYYLLTLVQHRLSTK